jgi:acyl carrier protein
MSMGRLIAPCSGNCSRGRHDRAADRRRRPVAEPRADDVNDEQPPTLPDPVSTHRVVALIRQVAGIDVADPNANLLATGIIDSLAFVSLLLAIEQEFAVSIDVNSLDLDDFTSVQRITGFIRVQVAGSSLSIAGEPPRQDGT